MLDINQKKIGIISLRFGIPANLPELDVILAHKDLHKRLANDPQFIQEFSRKCGFKAEFVLKKLMEVTTPRSLLELRTS